MLFHAVCCIPQSCQTSGMSYVIQSCCDLSVIILLCCNSVCSADIMMSYILNKNLYYNVGTLFNRQIDF